MTTPFPTNPDIIASPSTTLDNGYTRDPRQRHDSTDITDPDRNRKSPFHDGSEDDSDERRKDSQSRRKTNISFVGADTRDHNNGGGKGTNNGSGSGDASRQETATTSAAASMTAPVESTESRQAKEDGLIKRALKWSPVLVLENSGSVGKSTSLVPSHWILTNLAL
jgi:hypothetical protein